MNSLFTLSITHLCLNFIIMENDLLIINLLKQILEVQKEILVLLKNVHANHLCSTSKSELEQDLIDNVDVKSILKISDSTLYRLRRNKRINTLRIGGRHYYSIAEIKKAIRRVRD